MRKFTIFHLILVIAVFILIFSQWKYIGIEREKEYFEIAKARVEYAKNPTGLIEHNFWK